LTEIPARVPPVRCDELANRTKRLYRCGAVFTAPCNRLDCVGWDELEGPTYTRVFSHTPAEVFDLATIPDITETEQWILHTTLRERYGRDLELQLADAEIRLHASDRELTRCPVVVWQADDGCHFVIFKAGERTYRCQFFYKPYKQMGTGIDEYENLAECAVALLQVQADYVAEQHGDLLARKR
jgi:hypothetical protein